MKIISVRKGFACDHSSTSYEFLAVDEPLDDAARSEVASLSSRARPTNHTVSFIYHAEGYDIPGGWEPLLRDHYDVMYRESYDWWTLGVALNASEQQRQEIARYEFEGVDGLGVWTSTHDDRIIVSIYCRLDPGAAVFRYSYDDIYYRFGQTDGDWADHAFDDGLLHLLAQVREQLIDGDYRALYAVWELYGWDEEEAEDGDEQWPTPPAPTEPAAGSEVVEHFRQLLAPW